MANFLSKSKVKVAAKRPVTMSLSETHVTSLDFGQLVPIHSIEVIPSDKLTISPSCRVQVAPLYKPTFADISLRLRSFYVPFSLVWKPWNDFIAGNTYITSSGSIVRPNQVPYLTITDFKEFVQNSLFGEVVANTAEVFDISGYSTGTSTEFRVKLNKKGRHWLKVFEALGYNIPFASTSDVEANKKLSALPILCFFKVFLDYYTPAQLQNSNPLNNILKSISESTGNDGYHISSTQLATLCNNFLLTYDNDYFTSAWHDLNEPAQGSGSGNYGDFTIQTGDEDFPTLTATSTNQGITTQVPTPGLNHFVVDIMRKFANFARRNGLAGTRPVDRILARFDVKVPDVEIGMCKYLGTYEKPLDISQVISTSDNLEPQSSKEVLGGYSGHGRISGDRDFSANVEVNQHGMVFTLASLVPKLGFVDGISRNLFHLKRFDYYTPEFDGMTPQAIDKSEIFSRKYCYSASNVSNWNSLGFIIGTIFGFGKRYAEYKSSLDKLTGDFNLKRYSGSLRPFELFRRVMTSLNLPDAEFNQTAYTPETVIYQNDRIQYERIFNVYNDNPDPFYCVFNTGVKAVRCMLPLDDQQELDGNREVIMTTNGSRLN